MILREDLFELTKIAMKAILENPSVLRECGGSVHKKATPENVGYFSVRFAVETLKQLESLSQGSGS